MISYAVWVSPFTLYCHHLWRSMWRPFYYHLYQPEALDLPLAPSCHRYMYHGDGCMIIPSHYHSLPLSLSLSLSLYLWPYIYYLPSLSLIHSLIYPLPLSLRHPSLLRKYWPYSGQKGTITIPCPLRYWCCTMCCTTMIPTSPTSSHWVS